MRRLAFAPLLLLLGGCFTPVRAPSLAPRPIEQEAVLAPAGSAEPEVAASPGLMSELAQQVAAATAGDAAFATAHAGAERMVAATQGQSPGSEAWTQAQQAVSALDAALAPARDAADAVEALRQDPANAGSGGRAAVEAAAQRIEAIQARENAQIATLVRRLP